MILTTHRQSLPNITAAAPKKPAPAKKNESQDSVQLSGGVAQAPSSLRVNGARPKPVELNTRPQAAAPDSGSGFKLGMAALAGLSLLGAAAVALPAQAAPQSVVVQDSTVQSLQGPDFRLKEQALPQATDNATAARVRQDLDGMLGEVTEQLATYNQRLASLQLTGAKLDGYAENLGPGVHQVGQGSVSVRKGESYSVVRLQEGDVITQSIRNGDSRLVEVKSPQETLTLMESPGIFTVDRVEGSPLKIGGVIANQSSHHFNANTGEFTVTESTAWGRSELTLHRGVISNSETYRVHGIAGDMEVTNSQRIEEPEFSLTLYPSVELEVQKSSSVWTPGTGEKTESQTLISVYQDGSTVTTRIRNGNKETTREPGVETETAPVTKPAPIFFP